MQPANDTTPRAFETGTPVTVHGDFATLCEALKEAGVLK
jgi:hypothetical protein